MPYKYPRTQPVAFTPSLFLTTENPHQDYASLYHGLPIQWNNNNTGQEAIVADAVVDADVVVENEYSAPEDAEQGQEE
ncbi:hypothetical protein BGZ83_007393 [Gryganskiella cystojenkinii]|nr:hypothetical protein BGZ83_007393 [Gryganskiella cystojenkinii]